MEHEAREMRTELRRRKRRKRRTLSYPLRLAGVVVTALLVLWGTGVVFVKAAYPYWLGYDMGSRVTAVRTKLRQQRAENEALRARIRYLRSDEGAETLARRAGWRRRGESVIFFAEKPAVKEPNERR